MQAWGVNRIYQHAACLTSGLMQTIIIPTTTFNPSDKAAGVTLSGGNLVVTGTSGSVRTIRAIASGKGYAEVRVDNPGATGAVGCANSSATITAYVGANANGIGYWTTGDVYQNSSVIDTIGALSAGDIVNIAVDRTAGKMWLGKNGTFSGNPAAGTGGYTLPAGDVYVMVSTSTGGQLTANFGASAFAYSPPSGFPAWG